MLTKDAQVFSTFLFASQIALCLIYFFLFKYVDSSKLAENAIWPLVRDVSIMIFVGFGFLMTFLRRYGYSAVGYTLLISTFVVEIGLPIRCMYNIAESVEDGYCHVGLYSVLDTLFCAGAVMISFGALLGRTTPSQLLVLAIVETFGFMGNVKVFELWSSKGAHDIGGGMTIHTLGAYCGLTASLFMHDKRAIGNSDNSALYSSDLFSLIGTTFLWIMWPSFNAVLASDDFYNRAILNTFISLCACSVITFTLSRLVHHGKFEIVHIQNSTLAGGVAMGVAADLDIGWGGAFLGGLIAGIISVLGYAYLSPFLLKRMRLIDVCGVHNLHGMPGLLSAFIGIIAIRFHPNPDLAGDGLSQSSYEVACLGVTLAIAIGCGVISGLLMRIMSKVNPLDVLFKDGPFWSTPSDYEQAPSDVEMSKKDKLEAWLDSKKFDDATRQLIRATLVKQHCDLETLRACSEDELKELGLPFGARKALFRELQNDTRRRRKAREDDDIELEERNNSHEE